MGKFLDVPLSREQIRTIISLAERGSFYQAAKQLGVRQPAVSQLLNRLEESLSRKLFLRGPTGVSLTPDGEAILIYAKAMSKLGVDLRAQLEGPGPETMIRVGLGEEFNRTSLPTVLSLIDRSPFKFGLSIQSVIPSEMLFDRLDRGELDVVIAREGASTRSGEPICTWPTLWIGREEYEARIPDPVPLVLPASGVMRRTMLEALASKSRTWRIVFEGTDLASVGAALRAGLGVCACGAKLTFDGVAKLGPDAGLPELPPSVYVLERSRTVRSEAIEALCQVLRSAARMTLLDDFTDQPRSA